MAEKAKLTHSGQQLDGAITEALTSQIDADEIDILFTDLSTESTIVTGSLQGWLDPYLISGVI